MLSNGLKQQLSRFDDDATEKRSFDERRTDGVKNCTHVCKKEVAGRKIGYGEMRPLIEKVLIFRFQPRSHRAQCGNSTMFLPL